MASLRQNVFFLLQLSLLLCISITVHGIPPAEAPVNPPVHPPVNPPPIIIADPGPVLPPVPPPVNPPNNPPINTPIVPSVQPPAPPPIVNPPKNPPISPPIVRPPHSKLVAVQGRVFCKSCKDRGFHVLTGAAPLHGAVVKLECHIRWNWWPWTQQAKTDRNGFFYFAPQKWLTTFASNKCKVYLVSSHSRTCSVATNLNGGATGAPLIATRRYPNPNVQLFTVGPFAFEPRKNFRCHPH